MTINAASKKTLKQRLQESSAVLAPGVYDSLTALIAAQAGFETLYLSGASIAYNLLGRSDIGLATRALATRSTCSARYATWSVPAPP